MELLVKRAWYGNLDQSTAIQADILPAFSYFGAKSQNKYFTMVRPYILTTGSPSILYDINVNYLDVAPTGTLATVSPNRHGLEFNGMGHDGVGRWIYLTYTVADSGRNWK